MIYLSVFLSLAMFAQVPNEKIVKKFDHISDELVANKRNGLFIEQKFNLDHSDVSEYMMLKINTLLGRGEGTSADEILDQLIENHPGKTLEWILDHYDQFSPIGLRNIMSSLARIDNRECFQLLSRLLHDRRLVLNEHAARISPPPYYHDRVCDCAYSVIAIMLYKQKKFPQGFSLDMSSSFPYEQRNKILKRFLDWWSGESDVIIQNALPLSTKHPSLQYKLETVMQKPIPPGDR